MRYWSLLVVILLLSIITVVPAFAVDTYKGYVTSLGSNAVMTFDPNTNAIVSTFSTGVAPRDVLVGADGNRIYVTHTTDSTVWVYDTTGESHIATITLPGPAIRIALNELGTRLYAVDMWSNKIYVIDTGTNTLLATMTTNIVAPLSGDVVIDNGAGKGYVTDWTNGRVVVFSTSTYTISGYIAVGVNPGSIAYNSILDEVYVTNNGGGTVSVIDPGTDTVAATITVQASPYHVVFTSDGTKALLANSGNMTVINTGTRTISNTVKVGNDPRGIALSSDDATVYIANIGDNNISIVDMATMTKTGSINCTSVQPESIIVAKIAPGIVATPMQVTFTIMGGSLLVTDVNVSIYDAYTGSFIGSDTTDDAGNSIFWLIPGKRYNVTVTGVDVISSTQSVQVQPNRDQYTINVDTSGWSWNLFDWFQTNGTGASGSADQRRSITSGFNATTIGTTGYIEVRYNDTTGQTTSVVFQLYRRDPANSTYVLVDSGIVSSANVSYNFTILNSGNNTYRFYANGTSTLFGQVPRVGEHTFYNYNRVDLGWPSTFYGYFDILCFLLVAYASVKRRAVLLAGAAFELFLSWIFLLIGWANGFGLGFPIMIVVFAIVFFAYAVSSWRMGSGF